MVFAKPLDARFNMETLMRDIDRTASIIVAVIRTIVAVLTVPAMISVGITLWQGKNSYALELVKTRLFFIFLGLLILFLTEPLVRFVLYVIGY